MQYISGVGIARGIPNWKGERYPHSSFAAIFRKCAELGLKLTAHAGHPSLLQEDLWQIYSYNYSLSPDTVYQQHSSEHSYNPSFHFAHMIFYASSPAIEFFCLFFEDTLSKMHILVLLQFGVVSQPAAEEGPPTEVWEAINQLKVDRIDHGVGSLLDQKLLQHLQDTRLPLTVCPLSNYKVPQASMLWSY